MTPEEILVRMEAMFQRVVVDHDARLRVLEQKNTLKQIVISAITSTIVAVVAMAVGG